MHKIFISVQGMSSSTIKFIVCQESLLVPCGYRAFFTLNRIRYYAPFYSDLRDSEEYSHEGYL